ncbi:MAG: hypothetical protein ACOCWZ_08330 [Spirochaetota bacterium]
MRKTATMIILTCVLITGAMAIAGPAMAETTAAGTLQYPDNTITTTKPYFLWQDIYNTKRPNISFKLIIRGTDTNDFSEEYRLAPQTCRGQFYILKLPKHLKPGQYSYSIQMLQRGKPIRLRRYYYHDYPLYGEFTIKAGSTSRVDSLPPEELVQYLVLERQNRTTNGYNSIFFTGSAAGSAGIGYLFYNVLNFGVISTVVAAVAFTSAAVGVSAAAYYGYHYVKDKRELNTILEESEKEQKESPPGDILPDKN